MPENKRPRSNTNVLQAYRQMIADKAQEFSDYLKRFEYVFETAEQEKIRQAKELAESLRDLCHKKLTVEATT